MSIINRMKPAFQKLEGGLFSEVDKADVGDALSKLEADGVTLMSWADSFMPDPAIPDPVMQTAIKKLKAGESSHYIMPIGSLKLRETLVNRIKNKYGMDLDPSRNIIINPGSDTGLMFAMMPFIGPGDEVMVHDPSYPNNFLNVELLGGKTVRVPTFKEDNFKLRIEEYEKRLTPNTKMVVLTNPNNPTGRAYTRTELEELAEFIKKNDLVCISDQAFEDLVFTKEGNEMVSIASIDGMFERTLTVCSVSKGLGLSGFRVGWTYGPDVILDKMFASAVSIQGATNSLAQMSVIPALEDDSFIDEYMKKYDLRRKHAYKIFNQIKGVKMALPEAGFFSWIDISKLGSSLDIANYLATEAKVNVNAGYNYGAQGEGFLRIIHGALWEDEAAINALERIATALQKLSDEKYK